jgi:hypothetical protein
MQGEDVECVRTPRFSLLKRGSAMATAVVQHEPLGLVVKDGGDAHPAPRILMWFWANEEETPEEEKDDH